MRTAACFVALIPLALLAAPTRDESVVRPIEIKLPGEQKGKPTEPTTITSKKELEKAVTDETAQGVLAKAVDFDKEKIVLFTWAGSGQDKVNHMVSDAKPVEITFTYAPGRTRDLRQHSKAFAVPKDAKVTIGK